MQRTSLRLLLPLLALPLTFACKTDDTGSDEVGETGSDTGTGTESGSESGTETASETDSGETGIEEPEPNVDWPTLDCDSLVPEYCMYPFPNNVFTTADANTPTGRRLALVSASLPIHESGQMLETTPYNEIDGFSPGQAMLTYLPNAAATGLPGWQDIAASLLDESPTLLIDAETGERVPHWAEIDHSTGEPDGSFMIRPAVRLADDTRYIVAIREVQNLDGEVIAPSEQFRALRDLVATDDADVEARRPLYADIFMRLAAAGVERDSLQIAWDFTTASGENNTGDLLHMRDDALSMYPNQAEGPTYTITSVDDAWETQDIAYKIEGLIDVPLYLNQPGTGARLVEDDQGLPQMQGMAQFRFMVMIPQSALIEPAPLLQFGHGLLGDALDVQTEHLRTFANEYNYVIFALDWIGMASDDSLFIANMLTTGTMHDFEGVSDRLHQAMVNFILGGRMMQTSFADDPDYGQYIDRTQLYYWGISQGGIFGGTYMSITPDIVRGCVEVPGQPYNLLLNRSVDFDEYFQLLRDGYSDSRDLQMHLALIQMLWDHVEPTGYTHRFAEDPFPGTPEREVLIRAAVGDHQVTTLGAHIMAREIGATHLDTGIREVWGLDGVAGPSTTGNAYVEYTFGLPADPIENIPQSACADPHGKLRKLDEARMQLDQFLRTGTTENFCMGGVCDFSDMSGC
ncbi:hypothetical protein ACNOYE_29620 [Nannocystaceae bacterium ST9]